MSHVAEINVEIRSLDALRAACVRIGAEFREGQSTYAWYGYHMGDDPLPAGFEATDLGQCEHAIHVPGATYEVGVVRRRDGKPGFTLLWDSWQTGGLEAELGEGAGRLLQGYAVEAAKQAARRAGHSVVESQQADGSVVLRVQA